MFIGQILLVVSDIIRSHRLISPFLVISAALTPDRIITGLSRLAFCALLETGDGGLAGPDNRGLASLKTTCDH